MGYVYIIRCDTTHYYKIGITENNLDKRLGELQIGNPFELIIEYSLETKLTTSIEQLLHSSLSKYNIRGEWFDAPIEIIMEKISILQQFLSGEDLALALTSDILNIIDQDKEVINGFKKCPYCGFVCKNTNIRRHMKSCVDFTTT